MKYAIIDIETTGSTAGGKGKITEIAIYIHDGQSIIDEFCSLVNPECNIPPFISKLTGIDNEMVEHAPRFFELAKLIVNITEDAVFVAHNASFDYNFIRQEFKSLGFDYNRDYLCTLQLSRNLLPGQLSYSLGKLCNKLNIKLENRHRAHGDALATVRLFELLLQKSAGPENITKFIRNDFLNLRFPPGFNRSIINSLPESPGVYYFHDSNGHVLYIGKSNNIKKRVLSHFRNKKNRRYIEMRNSIADITFEATGNELIALLMESEEIKINKPFYNRKQKGLFLNYSIVSTQEESGYTKLLISKKQDLPSVICTLDSFEDAEMLLEKLQLKFQLCRKYCGNEKVNEFCFGYMVKQCKGACIGKESPEHYNKRVAAAIDSLRFSEDNFMIVGNGRDRNEKSIVLVEKGRYLGYGFFNPEFTGSHIDLLKSCIHPKKDNKDIRQIIRNYLRKSGSQNLIPFNENKSAV